MGRADGRVVAAVPVRGSRAEPLITDDDHGWRRSEADLVRDQVRGIEEWTRRYGVRADAARVAAATREARLDLTRRNEARRLEHQALMARAQEQLARGARLLRRAPQAVLAHRNAWFTGKLADNNSDT